jgi:hypothetical protein
MSDVAGNGISNISVKESSDGDGGDVVESFRLLTYNILADCFVRVPGKNYKHLTFY